MIFIIHFSRKNITTQLCGKQIAVTLTAINSYKYRFVKVLYSLRNKVAGHLNQQILIIV